MAEGLKIWVGRGGEQQSGGHNLISMIERGLTDLPRSGKGKGACAPSSSAIPACSNRWLTGLTSLALFMLFAFFIIGEDFTPLACIFLPYGPLLQEPPSLLACVLHTRSPYVASAMMNVGCGWALDSLSLII